MKVILSTLNAKYIHKNLALRLVYCTKPEGFDAEIMEFVIKDKIDNIAKKLLAEEMDVVAFSCYIWNIEQTLELVKVLKAAKPDLHVVLAGPEVSFDPKEYLQQGVDAVVQGEGEYAIWEYLTKINNGEEAKVAGIYSEINPEIHYIKADIKDVQALEPYFLDFDIADLDKRYLYFETSRGCPYSCSYCLSSTDNAVRLFDEDVIIKQLAKIAKSNIKQVKLLDRTFNVAPQRALRIARYMNEHCPNQIFQFEIVAETLSDELLEFFTKEADKDRFRFEIGVQSFNPEALKAVGRIQNNKRLKEVIKLFQDADLTMHVDLIAGLPHEDYASFARSFDELYSLNPEEIQLGVLKLLKGTSLRLRAKLNKFEFESQAPYTIKSTAWVSSDEMDLIKSAAYAVEKLYNNDRAKQVINKILALGWYDSAFMLFNDLGQALVKLNFSYQLDELFNCFVEILANHNSEEVDAIIKTDYYRQIKTKPKKLVVAKLDKSVSSEYLRKFMEQYELVQNLVFKNCFVDYYYTNEVSYQVVYFDTNNKYARRFVYINNKFEEIDDAGNFIS